MLYFKKSWCILIYRKWYFTCQSNFLKTKNKFEVKCTNNKCNKKFAIIMLQIWRVICVYQINGIFRLFGKTKTKKNEFNEFYCRHVMHFVVQLCAVLWILFYSFDWQQGRVSFILLNFVNILQSAFYEVLYIFELLRSLVFVLCLI